MAVAARIAPCLWFDDQAEEAALLRMKKINLEELRKAVEQ